MNAPVRLANRSQALREVQLALLAQGRHPYFWASFLLSGNPAALDGSPRFPSPGHGARGCGCEVGRQQGDHAGVFVLVVVLAWLWRRRRRQHATVDR